MSDFEYVRASDLDYAWLNFELDLPLPPGPDAEIRGEYRRFLTREERDLLREVRGHNRYDQPEKIAPLLQTLAALEYANGEPWCDAHPALYKLLDEAE